MALKYAETLSRKRVIMVSVSVIFWATGSYIRAHLYICQLYIFEVCIEYLRIYSQNFILLQLDYVGFF